ncbi:MAG: hypothetical protein IJ668_10370 [Selenomonadaceae bacterium]|nr:hypothetical protein [Selenomonadaceae bacterium]
MKRWVLLGDESRWIFAERMLQTSIGTSKTLLMKHGNTRLSWEGEVVSSFNVPPGFEVLVPAYGENMDIDGFDNFAIFESMPYWKEATEVTVRLLDHKDRQVIIVLTDSLDESIKLRQKQLLERGFEVMAAGLDGLILVLHQHRRLSAEIKRQMKMEIADIKKRAEELDYSRSADGMKCLSDEAKEEITAFNSVKGRPHLWKSYNETAVRFLFLEGLTDALGVYKNILYRGQKSITSFIWDEQSNVAALKEKIKARFFEYMRTPKKYQVFMSTDEQRNERIYQAVIEKPGGRFYGIKTVYLKRYEEFIRKELMDIIKDEAMRQIRQMEGLMK